MAQRRMFSLKIIDTDDFINMPTSTRLFYLDLAIRADDDGFVASPNKIMRMTGASLDDYKILLAKKYLIQFESGVCVIKHWRIHNYINTDRYSETEYKEEKSRLQVVDNKYDYRQEDGIRQIEQQNVVQVVVQDGHSGKDRLGKDKEKTYCEADASPLAGKPFPFKKKTNLEWQMYEFNFDDFTDEELKHICKTKAELREAAKIVLSHFNWATKKNYRFVDANLQLIERALATGVTIRDCVAVNARKANDWSNNPDFQQYLRPKTLYAKTNFENYLGEVLTGRKRAVNYDEKPALN